MDEIEETVEPSAGEMLRSAREEKGLSLEDIASQTRIPRRHLESLEESDWAKLPAPTYTIGFAKSFATAVGIDRTAIGDKLRDEMGGTRPEYSSPAEVFEPADPARTMPKWLVLSAIAGIILVVLLMTWLNNRSLEPAAEPEATANEAVAAPQPQPQAPVAAQGPVVLSASEPVWISVSERGGGKLFEGVLSPGQDFQVPSTATAPLLRTGKPEALRITVGGQAAPAVGPAATTVRDVSLLPADLMRGPQAAQAAAPPVTAPVSQTQSARPPARRQAPPAASAPPPPENPTGNVTNGAAGQ